MKAIIAPLCLASLLAVSTGLAQAPAASSPTAATAAAEPFPIPSPAIARRVGELIDRVRQSPPDREQLLAAILDVGPSAIPLVLAELERRSPASWAAMIYTLGAFGDPRAIPYLRREMTRETGIVYLEILYALTLAGDPEAPLLALRSTHATASFAPEMTAVDYIAGAVGPPAVPMLLREVPRRGQDARMAGLLALGTIADSAAVPFLLEWSRQPNPVDRRQAIIALARIGDLRAAPRLVEALTDTDSSVRDAAAEGTGYLRDQAAIPALVKLLQPDATSVIEQRAIWSLGLIGGPVATKALLGVLGAAGGDRTEQAFVLRALGKTRDPAAIAPLGPQALGQDPVLASTAVRALAEIESQASSDALLAACADAATQEAGLDAARTLVLRRDPRAMPCALDRLRADIARRNGLDPVAENLLLKLPLAAPPSAAVSLETTAESIAAPALQYRLIEAAHLIRMVNERGSAVEPWLQVLENGTPGEVDLAIERLADLGDLRAIEPLQSLFGRIEPDRAWRIPEALGRLRSERATSFLIRLLVDDVYRVPSLARAREEAARALARFSRSPGAADALRTAFEVERGRLFVPLLAYARVRGTEGIPDLLRMKSLLLRSRGNEQVLRHEKANWAIRMLRAGQQIPIEEVRDVM